VIEILPGNPPIRPLSNSTIVMPPSSLTLFLGCPATLDGHLAVAWVMEAAS
jgi:hypothetical protein